MYESSSFALAAVQPGQKLVNGVAPTAFRIELPCRYGLLSSKSNVSAVIQDSFCDIFGELSHSLLDMKHAAAQDSPMQRLQEQDSRRHRDQ